MPFCAPEPGYASRPPERLLLAIDDGTRALSDRARRAIAIFNLGYFKIESLSVNETLLSPVPNKLLSLIVTGVPSMRSSREAVIIALRVPRSPSMFLGLKSFILVSYSSDKASMDARV
ncbi:hypothetical protein [Proteus columbae]|uniref:hypothetical protein n=1 Tax=Proteus columbae TaxID=1987580 RepID=UPI00288B4935|nr:hypothetical protein [Proteus columbae]